MRFNRRLISIISVVSLLVTVFSQVALAETNIIAEWNSSKSAGMTMTGGKVCSDGVEIGGSDGTMDRISFNIDEDVTFNDGQNYYIKVEYKHEGAGFFFAEYKNTIGENIRTDFAYCDGSGRTDTATLLLDHPEFNKDSGVDFKISCAIDRSSRSNYSEEKVKITAVTLYTDGTYKDADVNVTSNNTGNIFYTGEDIKLKMYIENLRNISQDINVEATVYSLDKNDEKNQICTFLNTIQVDALTKNLTEYVVSDCDQYGRYLMTVHLSGGERGINVTKSFEFSRAVYSKYQNFTYGINTHTGNERGFSGKVMELAKNAGVGMVRETYNWETYEPKGDGQMALTDSQTKALQYMNDNGLSARIVIYGNNRAYETGSDFVTDSNMTNYENYIKSFVQEDTMKNVVNFEIYNEPDLPENKTHYNGSVITDDSTGTANYKRGVYYAKMLITAYDAIKSVRKDAKVSAMSFCRVVGAGTDEFLQGAASVIKPYYVENNKLPFDDISVHPYIGNINPEQGYHGGINNDNKWNSKSIQDIVEYWRDFFNEAVGCTDISYPIAVTEYGWSNRQVAESYSPNYATNEHEQAVLNLRAYLVMKGEEFAQRNFVYDFMDDGLRLNTQEHNFGMVRNEDYRVPYAAKAEYISVAALNNFIADATACNYESISEDNYHNVLRFTRPAGDVYVVWTTSKDSDSLKYNFDNVEFYDMYGNKLNIKDIKNSDGTYKISTEPYYAVTGGAVFDTPAKKLRFVNISGNIRSENSNVPVSLTVLPKDIEFGETMQGSIVYFDQGITFDKGGFEFKVKSLEHEKWYTAYISSGDNSGVCSFDFRDVSYPTCIELYSGTNKIDSINLGSLNTSDNHIKVHIADDKEILEYTVGIAYYKEQQLQNVKTAQGTTDGETIDVSIKEAVDFDTVKVFMWNSLTGMIPLCRAEMYVKAN